MTNEQFIHGLVSLFDKVESVQAEKQTAKLEKPNDYTKTESVIHDMLTENTGVNMLDSGGIYGRSWQKNRSIIDFRNTEEIILENWNGDIGFSKNIFHYLTEHLEYSEKWTKKFIRFSTSVQNKDKGWLDCMDEFSTKFNQGDNYMIESDPISTNTYNYDNCLNGTLQYNAFYHEDQYYVILQIHGGCDVRGGYTEPKIFTCDELDQFQLAQVDLNFSCECDNMYSDDSGYHWYDEDLIKSKKWNYSKKHHGIFCKDCKGRVI